MKKILIGLILCVLSYSCINTVQQPIQETKEERQKEFKIISTNLSGPAIEVIQHPTEGTLFMLDKRDGDVYYYIQSSDSIRGYWENVSLSYPEIRDEEYPHPNRYQLVFAEGISDVIVSQQLKNERNKWGWQDKPFTWSVLKKDEHGHWHKHTCFFKDNQENKKY